MCYYTKGAGNWYSIVICKMQMQVSVTEPNSNI